MWFFWLDIDCSATPDTILEEVADIVHLVSDHSCYRYCQVKPTHTLSCLYTSLTERIARSNQGRYVQLHGYPRQQACRSEVSSCKLRMGFQISFGFSPSESYRLGLRAKANFSAPTFEPAHEAGAGQRAALLVQSAAAAMQHPGLDQRSESELSLLRALCEASSHGDFS